MVLTGLGEAAFDSIAAPAVRHSQPPCTIASGPAAIHSAVNQMITALANFRQERARFNGLTILRVCPGWKSPHLKYSPKPGLAKAELSLNALRIPVKCRRLGQRRANQAKKRLAFSVRISRRPGLRHAADAVLLTQRANN